PHTRDELGDPEPVPGGQDLVPHRDPVNLGLLIIRLHVGGHPLGGGPGVRESRDVAVADGYRDRDVGVGEGVYDVGNDIEYLDAVDDGLRRYELRHLGRPREVVGYCSVVDPDGGGAGGEVDGHGGNEEEVERSRRHRDGCRRRGNVRSLVQ
ncbi:unnamed protein product, partial [Linum tenue]